ncbi:hypothetical protein E2C01_095555 [Portunus trituberculatus]|uniref:Uncharacterized protein n=1 Tax=Portunus trituberculatus TaxID=210409 RepID=A0A5B7K623_PORTR|nr:hypothetical protein [Portunus trituberculatus]
MGGGRAVVKETLASLTRASYQDNFPLIKAIPVALGYTEPDVVVLPWSRPSGCMILFLKQYGMLKWQDGAQRTRGLCLGLLRATSGKKKFN